MKWIAKLLLSATITCTAFAATGCDLFAQTISAYDIAVENGFVGTETEWLQSLKGANGKDADNLDLYDAYLAAVERGGYEGDFLSFIQTYFSADVQEDNDIVQLAHNTMSVVSVYAGFTTTTQGFMGQATKKAYSAAGSGVIIDLDKENGNATVITNYHVIYDGDADTETGISDSIYLYLYGSINAYSTKTNKDEGGDGMKAKFLGGSMDYDVAVLEIEGSDVLKESIAEEANIGDSKQVSIGEKVFAIGNPEGAGISVTEGALSVDSEYIYMESTDGGRNVRYRVMRTDAAINHGNSGGALFNARGELIGITNAKSTAEDVDNMGYALPIDQVMAVAENALANGGKVKRAYLGVELLVTDSVVTIDETRGLVVEETVTVSADAKQGEAAGGKLYEGDVLTLARIGNGETVRITRLYQISDLLLQIRSGDTLTLTVVRNGQDHTVQIWFTDRHFTAVA